jgi:hypothetical protein
MLEDEPRAISMMEPLPLNRPRRPLRDPGRHNATAMARGSASLRARRRNTSIQDRSVRVFLPHDVAVTDLELEAIETFLQGVARTVTETLKR